MHLYLGYWEWDPTPGDARYCAPGASALGALDLRTLPDQSEGGLEGMGLFLYATPQTHPLLIADLGRDLGRPLSEREKRLFQEAGGGKPTANRLQDTLRQLCFDPDFVDPTGVTKWKPLRPAAPTSAALATIGGQPLFRKPERIGPKHPAFANTIAVFQADYARHRPHRDPVTLRKWTGDHLLQLFGRLSDLDADSLLPSRYRHDGFQMPETTFTETWPTDSSTISTGQDQPWNEDSGNVQVTSGKLAGIDLGVNVFGRCTTNLSSDGHKHTATIDIVQTVNNIRLEVTCRKVDSTVFDAYACGFRRQSTSQRRLNKYVNNALTVLSSDSGTDAGTACVTYVQAVGSTISGNIGGTPYSATDTAITGNLQVGYLTNCGANPQDGTFDSHTAEDIASADNPGARLLLLGVG